MTVSMRLWDAADGCEVAQRCLTTASGQTGAVFRRGSAQPSRRAVLHVRGSGDAAAPRQLVSWYSERAFQFYVADVRLPAQRRWPAMPGWRSRSIRSALADLDAAHGYLRDAQGMHSVIVTACGGAALATALWTHTRQPSDADALILHAPALPRRGLRLSIFCPVLVLTGHTGAAGVVPPARTRGGPDRPFLGSHVTWLQLRGNADPTFQAGRTDLTELFGELGRWLGAYMYGQPRDQLL
jgi:hypothetical protein